MQKRPVSSVTIRHPNEIGPRSPRLLLHHIFLSSRAKHQAKGGSSAKPDVTSWQGEETTAAKISSRLASCDPRRERRALTARSPGRNLGGWGSCSICVGPQGPPITRGWTPSTPHTESTVADTAKGMTLQGATAPKATRGVGHSNAAALCCLTKSANLTKAARGRPRFPHPMKHPSIK